MEPRDERRVEQTGDLEAEERERLIARRVTTRVLARLDRRRRRIRRIRLVVAGAAAAAAAAVGLQLLWVPPAGEEAPPVVEAPGEPPPRVVVAPDSPPTESPADPEPPEIAPEEERQRGGPRSPPHAASAFLRQVDDAWVAVDQAGPGATVEPVSAVLARALPELGPQARSLVLRELAERGGRRRRGGGIPFDDFVAALGWSGSPEAWPLLARLIEVEGPRPFLIRAVGELGDSRAVPLLERWLRLGDERSRLAADALRRIPGRRSLEALLAGADTMRRGGSLLLPGLHQQIQEALREREGELCRFLFEGPREQRLLVMRTLSELRSEAALSSLIRALERKEMRGVARSLLSRVAKRDLGSHPAPWWQWLESANLERKERT